MPFHQIGHNWPLFGMFTQYLLKYNYEIVVRLIFCKFWAFDFFRPNSSKLVQTRLLLNQKWKKSIWVFFLLNFCHWFQFWVLKKPKMINKAVSFSLCTWRKIFFASFTTFCLLVGSLAFCLDYWLAKRYLTKLKFSLG